MKKYLVYIYDKNGKIFSSGIYKAYRKKEAEEQVKKDAEWLGCKKYEIIPIK